MKLPSEEGSSHTAFGWGDAKARLLPGGTRAGANVRSGGAQKSALPRAVSSRASGGGKKDNIFSAK